MSVYEHVRHEFAPVYDADSEILILGSLPSVKSREQGFYYGHPNNRFWKVLSALFETDEPQSIDEKKELLLSRHIALWDTVSECDIEGSSDSSIRNVIPNDIGIILNAAPIHRIFANGQTAGRLYRRYLQPVTQRDIEILPSTSPANAAWTAARLIQAWQVILV